MLSSGGKKISPTQRSGAGPVFRFAREQFDFSLRREKSDRLGGRFLTVIGRRAPLYALERVRHMFVAAETAAGGYGVHIRIALRKQIFCLNDAFFGDYAVYGFSVLLPEHLLQINVGNSDRRRNFLDRDFFEEIGIDVGHCGVDVDYARLFVACSNPFEFSKFKMWDPELDTSTGAKYPIPRVVSFGFNLSF